MKKKPLNLLVDEDLVKKARDHGLNLSRFFENQLRGYFRFIDDMRDNYTPYTHNTSCNESNNDNAQVNSKSNNTFSDNETNSGARGVAWYPSTLGW